MKHRTIAAFTLGGLFLFAGMTWLWESSMPHHSQPEVVVASPGDLTPAAASALPSAMAPDVPNASAATASRTFSPIPDQSLPIDPAHAAEVRAALDAVKKIYGQAGSLDWDQAKALIAQREKATREWEDRLAALGSGGAHAMAAGYMEADGTRARLLLVHALGKIDDAEAAGVIQSLLARESSFSLRKEMVIALGQRREPNAEQVLGNLLATGSDAQLRFASTQALSGRDSALPLLVERLHTETSSDVQRELVRSVGRGGQPAALEALAQLAGAPGDLALRQTAIQELGRSFGASALDALGRLLHDPDEAIRNNAVAATARVKTDAALALLQRTAGTDASAAVRHHANAAMASLQSDPASAVRAQ